MVTRSYPKPEILTKVRWPHEVIEASAGTGKTFTLEHLVVDLILVSKIPLDRILVVTFTEKAATELRVRIRKLLHELLEFCSRGPVDVAPRGAAWVIDDEAKARIVDALTRFDAATIGTIHSYCQRALREIAFDAGRPFTMEITATEPLAADAFRYLFRHEFASDVSLNDAFAARGTEAYFEASEGVRKRGLPLAPTEPEVEAALAALPSAKELAAVAKGVRSGPGASAKTAAAVAAFLAELPRTAFELAAAYAGLSARQQDFLAEIDKERTLGLVGNAVAHAAAETDPRVRAFRKTVGRVVEKVRERKDAEGLVDFDDLVGLLDEALDPARSASAPKVAEKLRARFDAVLLDEFQDTDEKQWAIFRRLFHTDEKRIVLVGDPKQAIYAFRGGDLPTYRSAVATLTKGGRAIPLTQNFRSSPALLATTNALLASDFFHGDNRASVVDESSWKVTAGRADRRFVDAHGVPLPPILVPVAEGETGRKSSSLERRRRVMDAVARALVLTVEEGHIDDGRGGTRPLTWGDCFLLTASHSEAALAARALRRRGVPCSQFKEEGLFQTRDASDLHDLLLALVHPRDRSRELRAFQTVFFGCDAADIEALAALPETHPLLSTRNRLRELAGRGPEALLTEILAATGVRERLLLCEAGERRITNIEQIVETCIEASRGKQIDRLAIELGQWIRKESAPPGDRATVMRLEGGRNTVQILTMHTSKGLERPVVAVVSLGSRRRATWPSVFRKGEKGAARPRTLWLGEALPRRAAEENEQELMGEEERVAYVALTRACHRTIVPLWKDETGVVKAPGAKFPSLTKPLQIAISNGVSGISVVDSSRLPERASADAPPHVVDAPSLPAPEQLTSLDPLALFPRIRPRKAHSFTSLSAEGDSEPLGRGDIDTPVVEEVAVLALDRRADEMEAQAKAQEAAELDSPFGTLAAESGPEPAKVLIAPDRQGPRWGDFVHRLLEGVLTHPELRATATAHRGERIAFCDALVMPLLPLARELGFPLEGPPGKSALFEALGLVFNGLSADLGGFCILDVPSKTTLCELEFHTRLHARGEGGTASPLEGRDRLFGSIDVAFEYAGKIHLVDWKTNRLDQYDAAAIAHNVASHYALQVQVYTVAAARYFGIEAESDFRERFGGVHYVYLRAPASGVHSMKPTPEALVNFRADLQRRVLATLPAGGTASGGPPNGIGSAS